MRALDLWSQSFLSDAPDAATCQLPIGAWRMVHDDFPDVTRLIGKITVGSKSVFCALGNPLQVTEAQYSVDNLYIPLWAVQSLGIEGAGERGKIEWLSQDAFPEATQIVLKPHDSAFYGTNVKDVLEVALTRFGVLQTGDTIPVQIEALGGMEIWCTVVRTEPANVVLLQGEEVELLFEGEPEAPRPQQQIEEPFDPMTPMIPLEPEPSSFPGQGRVLGGGSGPRVNPWKLPPKASS